MTVESKSGGPPNSLRPLRVFCSYAREDEALNDELKKHLAQLLGQGLMQQWDDGLVRAGEETQRVTSAQLEKADLILLLVSKDFLSSSFCVDGLLTRALERVAAAEARIVPIVVRSCLWTVGPLSGMQALPRNGRPVTQWTDRDEAWTGVVKELLALEPGLHPRAVQSSPRAASPVGQGIHTRPSHPIRRHGAIPWKVHAIHSSISLSLVLYILATHGIGSGCDGGSAVTPRMGAGLPTLTSECQHLPETGPLWQIGTMLDEMAHGRGSVEANVLRFAAIEHLQADCERDVGESCLALARVYEEQSELGKAFEAATRACDHRPSPPQRACIEADRLGDQVARARARPR